MSTDSACSPDDRDPLRRVSIRPVQVDSVRISMGERYDAFLVGRTVRSPDGGIMAGPTPRITRSIPSEPVTRPDAGMPVSHWGRLTNGIAVPGLEE